jgi:uncharacterized protein with von Willebrand factor type A (vWA) domain
MNFETQSEFIRLVNNEPLTLACSALADFLWDDFIRDSRPVVTYLIDHHNIKQLSRFGKEIFDRLYNGDNVKWLISEEAYEQYFRKVCDGDSSAIPEGYKPENGIWYAIMSDLSQAAGWGDLLTRCVGNQFNAGNNAVNILNKLSEVIQNAIEEQQFDVNLLTAAGEKLQQLREQYQAAKDAGETKKAEEARRAGKALNQAINEALQQALERLQPQTNQIVDQVIKDNDETNEALSTLHGVEAGTGQKLKDLKEKQELANKLKNNKKLRELTKKLGALRRVWTQRKRAKKTSASYESITGATFSNDVTKAFPAELALAGTPQGRALFALKFSQKTILTKDYTAHQNNLGKGPVVMYIDVSGSMSGEPELWSKAIAFVIAEEALKQKRKVWISLFDTRVDQTVELRPGDNNLRTLLDFVGAWTLGGGTSFNAVLSHAVDKGCKDQRADVLMITDGHSDVNENLKRRVNAFKTKTGTQWSTVCINTDVPDVCREFSDDVYSVNVYNTENTIDAIQKCLR